LITTLFHVTLAAEVLSAAAVIFSILLPGRRIWPPRRAGSWERVTMLALFLLSGVGVVLLGILDRNSYVFPAWVRIALGVPLGLAGNGLALWAVVTLGLASTSGEAGALVQGGPYRFSRIPQYLGFLLALAGWALMTDSSLATFASLTGIIPIILVPFAEEPWLRERLGGTYADYLRTVPRFIGRWKQRGPK
jgi:protein-S-isoprenylcysteine O-methyltransferase Ste14